MAVVTSEVTESLKQNLSLEIPKQSFAGGRKAPISKHVAEWEAIGLDGFA